MPGSFLTTMSSKRHLSYVLRSLLVLSLQVLLSNYKTYMSFALECLKSYFNAYDNKLCFYYYIIYHYISNVYLLVL